MYSVNLVTPFAVMNEAAKRCENADNQQIQRTTKDRWIEVQFEQH
jgi:hypothetical protein